MCQQRCLQYERRVSLQTFHLFLSMSFHHFCKNKSKPSYSLFTVLLFISNNYFDMSQRNLLIIVLFPLFLLSAIKIIASITKLVYFTYKNEIKTYILYPVAELLAEICFLTSTILIFCYWSNSISQVIYAFIPLWIGCLLLIITRKIMVTVMV